MYVCMYVGQQYTCGILGKTFYTVALCFQIFATFSGFVAGIDGRGTKYAKIRKILRRDFERGARVGKILSLYIPTRTNWGTPILERGI